MTQTEDQMPLVTQLDVVPKALHAEIRRQWSAYVAAAREQGIEAIRAPDNLARVWGASDFVARFCIRFPAVFAEQVAREEFGRVYVEGELSQRLDALVMTIDDEVTLMQRLRQFRHREMVRIAWRDLGGAADLDETLNDLSVLAECCTQKALAWCYQSLSGRYGTPRNAQGEAQQLLVLAMGKLGGRELNFSSDIDLVFAFAENGETDGVRGISNSEFFVRLGQQLIKLLSEVTADGFVFRVDMRLRPFGEAGPLAASFDALENYYQAHGREWERYALIKARAITGDDDTVRALTEMLRPFVYRRYLDFGVFAALREMKRLIREEVKQRGLDHNIKLGAGGIREIEFIGQAFQLIRGGHDRTLQQRSIKRVLRALGEKNLLSVEAEDKLLAAYDYLRLTENHLQMMSDEQTHVLPSDENARLRLAFSMGHADWSSFEQQLKRHRQYVSEQFEQVFAAPQLGEDEANEDVGPSLALLWRGELDEGQAVTLLANAGFEDSAEAWRALNALRGSRSYRLQSEQARERMDKLMPLLIAATGQTQGSHVVLSRLLPLIEAIARRSVYLSLLAETPMALSQLVKLCAASAWIAEYLRLHPVLLDELLDPRGLYAPPDRQGLVKQLHELLSHTASDDLEEQMERLRQFKHANVLRVAAADVMGALPLMRVSDQLTWIAEVVLNHTLKVCRQQLAVKHGEPGYDADGQRHVAGFAIVAYGKLGGIELGYGSDLDIVFIHDSHGERQQTDGNKPLDNAVFFARLAQRIVHMLTTMTPAGQLYEVDMRLRPSGGSGLLVSGLQSFEHYQLNDAWTWEHQALTRARVVAGVEWLRAEFDRIRRKVLAMQRDRDDLRREVREMRIKMRDELGSAQQSEFDLKKDSGGIADIEFMVQYLVLAYAVDFPALGEYTDNIRVLDALAASRLMDTGDVRFLQDAYRGYRDRIHALSLQDCPSIVDTQEFSDARARVQHIWHEVMETG